MIDVKNEAVEKKSLIDQIKDEPVVVPFVNIYETDDDFNLSVNMPGVSKEDVQIKVEEMVLTTIGKRNVEKLANRKYILRETSIGNFYRTFNLSDTIDVEKIEASFSNGQLNIKLPKADKVKPRTIQIN